jgi:outer membrane protein assembly factor BamB
MRGCRLVLILSGLGLLLAARGARADDLFAAVKLPGEDRALARRFEAIDNRVKRAEWHEALDEYQQVLAELADALVPLDREGRHSVQARWLCHVRLSRLPAEALRLYRGRVNTQAQKWFEQGAATRDTGLLRRVVEETFCSSFTDRALDILGDLAFERGDFDEAAQWWRLLALPASRVKPQGREPGDLVLVFPDPQLDVVKVRAKQLLAQLFRGDRRGLAEESRAFEALHAEARGELAGRKGRYADIVRDLARQPETVALPTAGQTWPTFAGDASRNAVLPRAPGRLGQLRPLAGTPRRVPLTPEGKKPVRDEEAGDVPSPEPGRIVPSVAASRSLAFYPVLAGDQVVVSDGRRVTAIDLHDGSRLAYDLLNSGDRQGKRLWIPSSVEPDSGQTLTVAGDYVFARLGEQALGPLKQPERGSRLGTYLVCLRLHRNAQGKRDRWEVKWESRAAAFEGAPVTHQGRLFLAYSGFTEPSQTFTGMVCYTADSGVIRWDQELCKTSGPKAGVKRFRHHLVTLAGTNLIYCSNSGAVVAVDALTGRRVWAVRYPSRGTQTAQGEPSPRSLVPCVYQGGRVYVAPVDFDRILCLDAVTGQLLWESSPIEVVHLLGVAKGRLIFTTLAPRPVPTALPRSGIRALDAATGQSSGGWVQPAEGELPTFGRGFLAGDYVYWPTAYGLRVLHQEDGEPVAAFDWNCAGGNLAAANGYLVVAGTEELFIYEPEESGPGPRREGGVLPGPALQTLQPAPGDRNLRVSPLAAGSPRPTKPGVAENQPPPALDLPLSRAWEGVLARDEHGAEERLLVPRACSRSPPAERLFTVRGLVVTCRDGATGRVCWSRRLSSAPSWVGQAGEVVFLAGEASVQGLRVASGEPLWEISQPQLVEEAFSGPLESVQLAGPRLFFLHGRRRLFAVEAESGRLLWARWAPAARLQPVPPAGRFHVLYHAGDDWLVLQTSGGSRLVLDSRTGRLAGVAEAGLTPWAQPPLPLDGGHVGIVTSPEQVVRLDPAAGKETWKHQLDWANLTGEPSHLVGNGQALFLVVAKNFGWELQRLDPRSGADLWRYPRPHSPFPIPPESVAFDASTLYFVSHGQLQARALDDGRPAWKCPLPSHTGSWRTLRPASAVIVYPVPVQRECLPEAALAATWSAANALARTALLLQARLLLREGPGPSRLCVLILDPGDGELLQRFNFTATGSQGAVQCGARGLAVALGDRVWAVTASPSDRSPR